MMSDKKDLHILVVDDMRTMRKIVRSCLTPHGYKTVTEAEDGDVAWSILERGGGDNGKVDLIVSDWNMPNMQGIELLKKCRGDERFRDIAFMMVTAEQEGGQVKEAIEGGVDAYVVKPFNQDSFGERLNLVLKKRFS